MRKRRKLDLVVIVIIATAVVLAIWLVPRPAGFEHPSVNEVLGVQVVLAHGSLLEDPNTGCAACHREPIDASCTDCHPTPPTIIKKNKNFPHHDTAPGGPPDSCQASSCHEGTPGDARYVVSPKASHSYCEGCHTLEHSTP